jgi:ligand-binding SRPBCC domain-containing protein
MPTYQREIRVRAPIEAVWQFHSRPEGLEALTPDWMHLRVEEVRGSDGATDLDVLETGTTVRASVRPFGLGPRQHWTSRIARREEGDGSAVFEDVMEDGPFPEWRHRHGFFAVSDHETLVSDRVTYELPVVGDLLGPLGWLGFEPMFRARHRRTEELLEGDERANDGEVADSRAEDQRPE